MADEPENHTLRLLREMREESNHRFDEMREESNRRFEEMREESNRRFDEMREESNRRFDEIRGEMREIRGEMGEMRAQTDLIPKLAGDVAELQLAVAAMRADQTRTNKLLETVAGTQKNHGIRLNAIDGRLALIEEHTGLVKA
jgi:DNA anti-recombination protein RmuC